VSGWRAKSSRTRTSTRAQAAMSRGSRPSARAVAGRGRCAWRGWLGRKDAGEIRLADPGRADDENLLVGRDPACGGKVEQDRPVEPA
jgi:hypothetical protein